MNEAARGPELGGDGERDAGHASAPVCYRCDEGVSDRGCLIRLAWSTELEDYLWAHRVCLPGERKWRIAA
jgi:hypothetical protein